MIRLDAEYWEAKYNQETTGWDLGKVSNPIQEYIDQLNDRTLKILIPGGGNSYEAEYLHNQGFENVYVVDLAKTPLENLKLRVPNFPDDHLIEANFFNLKMKFDLILEQTFFCALNPKLRSKYAQKMNELLKDNGKLIGLLFDDLLPTDRPPFGGNRKEYIALFEPYFNIEFITRCYNSESDRKGQELFIKLLKLDS